MRIISKIKDYYDSALVYGRDESLIFLREESAGPESVVRKIQQSLQDAGLTNGYRSQIGQRVPYSLTWSAMPDSVDDNITFATVRVVIVGFCGKLYPAVMYRAEFKPDPYEYEMRSIEAWTSSGKEVTEFSYLSDDADIDAVSDKFTAMMYCNTPKFATNYLESGRTGSKKNKNRTYSRQMHQLVRGISNSIADKHSDIFVDNKVPYFVVDLYDETISFLPVLKKLQFVKVKDPFTAMQELSMYVGGVIPRQTPEMVTISDKDRIAQHGFDKLSFRHPFK